MSIAMRIAILAWTMALLSLCVFLMLMIPKQKQILVDNLYSRANGLALSMHDVAASAAVNEDYSSVVSAAQTLLDGDPDLDFLLVMKNDGFSLVIKQKNWQVLTLTDSYWLGRERKTSGKIEAITLFEDEVYHFSQPFDYSGIHWGWIHVGLSLEDYNDAVSRLYQQTLFIALACIFISLVGSIVYARRMVRPIIRLRSLVQRIAEGNLSVRADMQRKDELGSLASSVNSMAESILHRNRKLESVRFAAEQFLQESQWEEVIEAVLESMGKAVSAHRARIYTITRNGSGRPSFALKHQWTAPGIPSIKDIPEMNKLSHSDSSDMLHWIEQLENNQMFSWSYNDCKEAERRLLERDGVRAVIGIPVFVEKNLWGNMVFDDCRTDRKWTGVESDGLRAVADMLGATIARQTFQEALLDAKATLELRVEQRTRELKDQVEAKEKAMSDLAAAQSVMVEMSRAAGMAEVATGVLHNVGNVLNSVNVSCTLVIDKLRESRIENVAKVAELLALSPESLTRFLTQDDRGRQIPDYLATLGSALQEERETLFQETESLRSRIEHIKEIVAMQQNY